MEQNRKVEKIQKWKFLLRQIEVQDEYRTNRVNETINLMCLIDTQLGGKKNGTSHDILDLSQQVNWLGLEPRTHTLKVYCSTN